MTQPRFTIEIDDTRLDPAMLGETQMIDIHAGDDIAGRAMLRFALRQGADGSFPLLDAGPFAPAAALRILLSAGDEAPDVVFSGYISHLRPHFETIEANAYLEVLARDPSMLLSAEDRAASYPDASDSDAAARICGRYGLASDIEETDSRLAADDILLMQRSDDWAFLRHLAARNGFVVYFESDARSGAATLHFHPRRLDDPAQPDLDILRAGEALRWIDFQIACDRPLGREAAAIDALAKRIVRADAPSREPVMGEALVAARSADALKRAGAAASSRNLRVEVPRDATLNTHAAGASARDHMAIESRGELDPEQYGALLRAHRPVLIKGVGDRLAGAYYVSELTTRLSNGRITQDFVAISNALGRRGDEAFGKTAERRVS